MRMAFGAKKDKTPKKVTVPNRAAEARRNNVVPVTETMQRKVLASFCLKSRL
jgi:hypothetical protein